MSEAYTQEQVAIATEQAVQELLDVAKLNKGDILVVGCSTSEVQKQLIGSNSNKKIGSSIYNSLQKVLVPEGIYLAAQCCEHLNRALVIEGAAARLYGYQRVNAVP